MPILLSTDIWHWRQRAVEFRSLADTIQGEEARDAMLRMASHYDQLAKRAEERVEQTRQPGTAANFKFRPVETPAAPPALK